MKKKPLRLKFSIALTEFYTFAMGKVGFMKRDLAEFVKFGITEEKLNAQKDLLAAFSEIPTDDELLGAQVTATQEKDAIADQLRNSISAIMTRVENKFGFHSGTYRKFGISGVSDLDGGALSYSARRVHRVAQSLQTELQSEGLTTEMLDGLNVLLDSYNQALSNQEDAMADRDIATEQRIGKANEIYDLLVKYCDTGKKIWESRNEAKYNDYIIYDTPTGKPDEKENKVSVTG